MKIHLKILPDNTIKEINIKQGLTLLEILKQLQLRPDNIIILRDNAPIPVDDVLNEEQELTIIKVASGG